MLSKKTLFSYLALLYLCCSDLQAQNNKLITDSLLQILPRTADTLRVNVLNQIAFATANSEPSVSFKHAQEALELARKLKFKRGESAALGIIGTFYEHLGDYAQALEYKLQALKISEQINIQSSLARSYNGIGILYFRQKKYDKALEYYQKALELAKSQNLSDAAAVYMLNIGEVYQEKGEYDKAVAFQEESMKISRHDPNMQDCVAFSLGIIGKCRIAERRYREARKNIEESIRIFRSIEDWASVAEYLIQLGQVHKHLKNYAQAVNTLTEAVALSRRLQNKIFEKDAHAALAEVHALQENFKEAFTHQQEYIRLHEAIFNEDSDRRMWQMQTVYETEKKQAQIEILQKDKKIREEEARMARTVSRFSLAVSLLIAVLFVVLLRNNRQKQAANRLLTEKNNEIAQKNAELERQKEELLMQSNIVEQQNKILQLQNEEIQKQRNSITASINYAQHIQTALLPDKTQLQKHLGESFVFYRPRDIVSGDFYYFALAEPTERGFEKMIIAAADCTGHGVPGALMSMIGNSVLNQLIEVQGLTAPAQILDALHRKIRLMLRQDSGDNRDGMDIALCTVDMRTRELYFAGAASDLYIVENNKLEVIRGDRQSIGGYHAKIQSNFTQYKFPIREGMRCYMTTDGFKDQFGGALQKKFSAHRFRDLLMQIQPYPMQEQSRIVAQIFDEWKNDQPQTDDVLVLGWEFGAEKHAA